MFETILDQMYISTDTAFPMNSVLICMFVAAVMGAVIGIVYFFITKHKGGSQSFFVSMIVLPMLISLIVILVNGNLARALSLAGIFTLIRFRSMPGDAKDLSFVLSAMVIGVAAGLGYLTVAGIVTLLICMIFLLTYKLGFGRKKESDKLLKIVIPEDLNYSEVFDDLFDKYCNYSTLKRIKTTNLGALYELSYLVSVKKDTQIKEMMDEIRCRNGNLMITLSSFEEDLMSL